MAEEIVPIHIEENSTKLSFALYKALKLITREWIHCKNDYYVNQKPFAEYYNVYQLQKPDSFKSTRDKRFVSFITDVFVKHLVKDNSTITAQQQLLLAEQLCYLLNSHSLFSAWQNTLYQRLSLRNYKLNCDYKTSIYLKTDQANIIELQQNFECIGTAVWYNPDYDENEPDSPPTINIFDLPQKLYSGQSTFYLSTNQQTNSLRYQLISATADLYATAMRRAFIKTTPAEEITNFIEGEDTYSDEEKVILLATKDYYLNNISAQQLQQCYISTNFYSQDFQNSACYRLIDKVLQEKPLPNSDSISP